MSAALWGEALEGLRAFHESTPVLRDFAAFPTDLQETSYRQQDHPVRAGFQSEAFGPSPHGDFIEVLQRVGDVAHWRFTYKDTDIGDDFLDRFGCYCLIGPEAPWTSASMFAFLVYMPRGLWYPWHHHPAEEIYVVLGGSGDFHRKGETVARLGPGEASFHASNLPHALETTDAPVLALVYWRNHFDISPVLTPEEMLG